MESPVVDAAFKALEEAAEKAQVEITRLRTSEAMAATLLQVASMYINNPSIVPAEQMEDWANLLDEWQNTQRYATCLDCEKHTVVRHDNMTRTFEYGSGEDAVTLSAQVTAWVCSECGAGYCQGDAEEPCDAAVREHLEKLKANG